MLKEHQDNKVEVFSKCHKTDAAKGGGKSDNFVGISHNLYAVMDGQKIPVWIHLSKLPDK